MKLSIPLTKYERSFGFVYLLVQLFILPSILMLLNGLLAQPLSESSVNFIFFCTNFLFVLVIFHRFLWKNLLLAKDHLWLCLRYTFLGYCLYYLGNVVFGLIVPYLDPDFFNVNDESIMTMVQEQFTLLSAATVFLVPVVEECLFRGVLFRGFHDSSRFAAYALSTLLFAFIHVAGYVGTYSFATLALCYVQYLPAGLALAWAYEKSDTIITPILMHMTINQLGVLAMR